MAEQESEKKQDSGEESDDEEVLEESPCGRWQKRREEVDQRDVPGIDNAFLAMDTEEGVEVVWNEVRFSEKRDFRSQQDKIREVFDNLCQLDHPNIIKFHKYWTDTKADNPRVVFISEYMSSGNLKQFLKKTKNNNKTFQLKAWKRWCTQILSALSHTVIHLGEEHCKFVMQVVCFCPEKNVCYLHSCDPPIIHANLTSDTVYIQHNGLIKIGSVAPDAIHHHVKTCSENLKNVHYAAPEYEDSEPMTTKVDIYSFGMCALEMATLGETGTPEKDVLNASLELVENPLQKDFIQSCLQRNPKTRPTARELLFHKVLFEVHSLKLLAAHKIVKSNVLLPENITEISQSVKNDDPNRVIAEICSMGGQLVHLKVSQTPPLELDKLLDDVKNSDISRKTRINANNNNFEYLEYLEYWYSNRNIIPAARNGIYPLTAYAMSHPQVSRPRAASPEVAESVKSETPEPFDTETRLIVSMTCHITRLEESPYPQLTLLVRFDDQINRQLQCEVTNDSGESLADDLVYHGFINEKDRDKVASLIGITLPNTSTVHKIISFPHMNCVS